MHKLLTIICAVFFTLFSGCKKESIELEGEVSIFFEGREITNATTRTDVISNHFGVLVDFFSPDGSGNVSTTVCFIGIKNTIGIAQQLLENPTFRDTIASGKLAEISGGDVIRQSYIASSQASKVKLSTFGNGNVTITFDTVVFIKDPDDRNLEEYLDTLIFTNGVITSPVVE